MIQLDGWIEYDTVAFAGPILERQKYTKFVEKGQPHTNMPCFDF